MPTKYIAVNGAITKIIEVNPRRETLTVINPNPHILVLADDDEPNIATNECHGIFVAPHSYITLERKDGDQPDHAWWVYCREWIHIQIFEGMTPEPSKRWW